MFARAFRSYPHRYGYFGGNSNPPSLPPTPPAGQKAIFWRGFKAAHLGDLRLYEITGPRDDQITRLPDYQIPRLPHYEFTRLRDYEITRLRDYEFTRLRDYEITRLPLSLLSVLPERAFFYPLEEHF